MCFKINDMCGSQVVRSPFVPRRFVLTPEDIKTSEEPGPLPSIPERNDVISNLFKAFVVFFIVR